MKQQDFLRVAKRELGLTYPALARELGVAARTIEKWSMDPASADHRPMPLMARRFILKLLDERKRAVLQTGDRGTAETIDAIAAQVDPERLAASLRTFDALQRSSISTQGAPSPRRKPAFFRDFAEKNEWQREEEARHARRIRAQATRRR